MRIEELILELRRQATDIAQNVDLDTKVEEAKRAAAEVRSRIETDPQARNAAIGAGGLLVAGLLGTKGGRNLVGGLAKTGAVAALGALAYKAWNERDGAPPAHSGPTSPTAGAAGRAEDAGYAGKEADDPEFAEAMLTAMVASAYADGVFDANERAQIDTAAAGLSGGRGDADGFVAFKNGFDESRAIETIAAAARSPNQAAELFAAAVVMATNMSPGERAFLERLRDALGLATSHADAIIRTVTAD